MQAYEKSKQILQQNLTSPKKEDKKLLTRVILNKTPFTLKNLFSIIKDNQDKLKEFTNKILLTGRNTNNILYFYDNKKIAIQVTI